MKRKNLINHDVIRPFPFALLRVTRFSTVSFDIPLHVVVDYSWEEEIDIVTAYIPDSSEWIKFQIRKRQK